MVSLLSGYLKLCRKPKVLSMFRLSSFCSPHIALDLPEVEFGSTNVFRDEPNLSEVIRPVKSYLMTSNPACIIFADSASISDCVELLESFAGTATEAGYNPWSYVDFSVRDKVLKQLIKCYKDFLAESRAVDGGLDVFVPGVMCFRILSRSAPRIDVIKIRLSEFVSSLVRKLKGTRSRCGAGGSKD